MKIAKLLKKHWLLIASAIVYAAVVIGIVLRHSVWQDEAQAWLIARDTPFFSMFSLAGYEGNGMLWHVLLYPLAHLGLPVMSMQILNAGFAFAAIYILFRYAPFPPIMRAGIAFGYFFIFEYATIARNYAISVFLIFLIAALYETRFARPLRFFVLLALLSLTNIHSLIIAVVLAAVFVWEAWRRRSEIARKTVFQCLAFFGLVCVAQAIMLLPPADLWHYTADTQTKLTRDHIAKALSASISAFMPIPERYPSFWTTSVVKSSPYSFLVSIALLLFSLTPFIRARRGLMIYAACASLLFIFLFLKPSQHIRHEGFIYIAWLFALWVSWASRPQKRKLWRWQSLADGFIAFALIASALGGERAARLSFSYPFSNSREMAASVARAPLGDQVLAYPSWAASALAPYLSSSFRFYCLETGTPCSYIVWTHAYDYSSNNAWTIKQDILDFQASHPGQSYYLFFKDPWMLSNMGLTGGYKPYAAVSHGCVSGVCSYYMYEYDPEATSTASTTPSAVKKAAVSSALSS